MDDNFWKTKTFADLALFLSIGEAGGFPAVTASSCMEKMHLALSGNKLPKWLGFLLESTRIRRGDSTARLLNVDRKSLRKLILNEKSMSKHLDKSARLWLEGGRQSRPRLPNRKGPIDNSNPVSWEDFLATRKKTQSTLTGKEIVALQQEYREKIVEPFKRAARGHSIRASIIEAAKQVRMRTRERAHDDKIDTRRNKKERKARSPELAKYRELDRYIREAEKFHKLLGEDDAPNTEIIESFAEKLVTAIEEDPGTYRALYDRDGKAPSFEQVVLKLRSALWTLLGSK